jgi:hypothetical protein
LEIDIVLQQRNYGTCITYNMLSFPLVGNRSAAGHAEKNDSGQAGITSKKRCCLINWS